MASVSCLLCQRGCVHCRGDAAFQHVASIIDNGDGYSPDADGCDDSDAPAYPTAPGQPDGIDDDCDSIVDEGTDAYGDDGDGDGYTEDGDDSDAPAYPTAPEMEDRADNYHDEAGQWYETWEDLTALAALGA